jgi:hypothetical protein
MLTPPRSPTHKPHPDSGGDELDDGEVVGVVLFESGSDGSEMLNLVEEALDEVSVPIEEGAEGRDVDAVGHGFDVRPSAALGQAFAQRVAVIGAVGEQDLADLKAGQHVAGAFAVVGLAFGKLERDRIAVCIDESVDLGGQSASRTPHASGWSVVPFGGFRPPFLTFAAC